MPEVERAKILCYASRELAELFDKVVGLRRELGHPDNMDMKFCAHLYMDMLRLTLIYMGFMLIYKEELKMEGTKNLERYQFAHAIFDISVELNNEMVCYDNRSQFFEAEDKANAFMQRLTNKLSVWKVKILQRPSLQQQPA